MQQWTRREQEELRVRRVKWVKRAKGDDPRFLAMGNVGGLNERYRKKGAGDIIKAIRDAIAESAGKKPCNPDTKFITDPAWPFGKPNPTRRK
jgi:hypothetical protein